MWSRPFMLLHLKLGKSSPDMQSGHVPSSHLPCLVSGLNRDPSTLSEIRHVPHLLFLFSLFMLLTLSSCECQTFLMAISFRLHFLSQTKTDSFGPDSQLIKISLSDGLLNLPDVAFKAPVALVSHRKAG